MIYLESQKRLIVPLKGYIGNILGLYRDNGKENGNYYITIGYVSTSGGL